MPRSRGIEGGVEPGIVERPGNDMNREPTERKNCGHPFPVAEMPGNEQDAMSERLRGAQMRFPFDRNSPRQFSAVKPLQLHNLRGRPPQIHHRPAGNPREHDLTERFSAKRPPEVIERNLAMTAVGKKGKPPQYRAHRHRRRQGKRLQKNDETSDQ